MHELRNIKKQLQSDYDKMEELKKNLRKIKITEIGIVVLCISFVFSGIMLFNGINNSPLQNNPITGFAQADNPIVDRSENNSIFLYVGTASFVMNIILLLLLVSHHLQLKSTLIIKNPESYLASTPKQAADEFFAILTKMLMKNSNIDYIYPILIKIRDEKSKNTLGLKYIEFKKNKKNKTISTKIKSDMDWNVLLDIFNHYLKELNIDEEKFISIAEYENRDNLVKILKELKKIKNR